MSIFISDRILPHHPDSEKFRGFSSNPTVLHDSPDIPKFKVPKNPTYHIILDIGRALGELGLFGFAE
tara:strand:- start:104 stop:304 length:201 start_codon:yes stop_codon:yes gene_type:complete